MRHWVSTVLLAIAVLWGGAMVVLWILGYVSVIQTQGWGVLNPLNVDNAIRGIVNFVVLAITMIPAYVLLWLSGRVRGVPPDAPMR